MTVLALHMECKSFRPFSTGKVIWQKRYGIFDRIERKGADLSIALMSYVCHNQNSYAAL